MIRSRLFLFRDNNYILCTFRFKTLQDVFIHLELWYTLHEMSFLKVHNSDTLIKLHTCSISQESHSLWFPKKRSLSTDSHIIYLSS